MLNALLISLTLLSGSLETAKPSNLIDAAKQADAKAAAEFIAQGADVNATNDIGATALFMAARYGNHRAVSELVKAGADVNAANGNGQTALDIARANKHYRVATVLRRNGAR